MESVAARATSAEYWDRYAQTHLIPDGAVNRAEWLAHPVIRERHLARRGGRALSDWFAAEVLGGQGVSCALGVGTGAASFELELLASGAVEHFDLYEISAASTALARDGAERLGVADRVQFFAIDMNEVTPGPRSYDLVTFMSSLHHVTELQQVARRVREALRPGGLLFASEYVGANRFAYPSEHNAPARALYQVLDPVLTCGLPELPQPDPAEVERADPSEAVHSEEITAVLGEIFDDLEVFPFDGCLAFTLWWGLNHDALFETARGMQLVELICDLEVALTTSGAIPVYFADIVARVSSP